MHAQETGQDSLANNIKNHMDLIHPMPHAFVNSGDNSARHAAKSRSMAMFQDVSKFGIHNSESLFLIEGNP